MDRIEKIDRKKEINKDIEFLQKMTRKKKDELKEVVLEYNMLYEKQNTLYYQLNYIQENIQKLYSELFSLDKEKEMAE